MNDEQKRRETHQLFMSLPGFPWLPCPICHYTESCDHTRLERAQAAHPGLVLHSQSNEQH